MNIGIIGYGAIGAALHRALTETSHTVVGVLARRQTEALTTRLRETVPVVTDLQSLLRLSPQIVVECAGHDALRAYGASALAAGAHLVVASVGALADPALEAQLRGAAAQGGRLVIPSGALGGLDALGAAVRAGLDEVSYTSRKAPSAWKGTKAEGLIDLESVTSAAVFFEGTARRAALDFPQNANVVAAIALAGVGFDRTRVRLMVDPAATGNRHVVEARGNFGDLSATVLARTLPENPKTSMLAPYSLVRAISNLADPVMV